MAQFDVHRWLPRGVLVVDCQSGLLSSLPTRFVVPLGSEVSEAPSIHFNPVFRIGGAELTLLPQLATTILRSELSPAIGSLIEHDYEIIRAIDMLMGGV